MSGASKKTYIRCVTSTITRYETVELSCSALSYVDRDARNDSSRRTHRVGDPVIAIVEDWREATQSERCLLAGGESVS